MVETRELESPDRAPQQNQRSIVHLIIFVFIISLISLLEVLGWIYGGGIYSLNLAFHLIQGKSQFVDIDASSFRGPIIIGLALISWVVVEVFRINLSSRLAGFVLALVVIGGGFVLDAVFEPPFTVKYMASRGYIRCSSRDHHVGNGKSRVWFNDYALSRNACSAGQ